MTGRPTSLDRRLLDAVRTSAPSATVLVLVGACGSGRTERLRRVQHELGTRASQYIDLERVSTTPERCLRAIIERSPFVLGDARPAGTHWGARPAFDALLTFLMNATNTDGSPATFLLDEILEMRTFESFPGLRAALPELARAIAHSRNHFIVSTRFSTRARRWVDAAPDRFELVPVGPLSAAEVRDAIGDTPAVEADEFAPVIHALVDGRPSYTRALLDTLATLRASGGGDPISALAASLARGGELDSRCRFSYELRLHRARGYGALKAILDVLAEEEPLTLTQIAQRLGRTPGSTKDYLSWLQDVDMLSCQRKRYSYADPVLRLWVRIHGHPEPPHEELIAREVQEYACARLQTGVTDHMPQPPQPPPAAAQPAPQTSAAPQPPAAPQPEPQPQSAFAGAGAGAGTRSGIIEID
jgi:hypothetical protein